MLEEYVDCVRDGLVCYGSFVRYNELSRQQRADMRAQEPSNKVSFRARQDAPDTIDADGETANPGGAAMGSNGPAPLRDFVMEDAQEEAPADDALAEVDPISREGEVIRIVRHLRTRVSQALAHGHFDDAADIQTTLTTVMESADDNPHLTLGLAKQVTGVYQRLYRRCRNRGSRELTQM